MKKTTSLLIATVLAFNVFAAEPAANFVVSEFTGSADFGFKTNFTDSNNVQMGMYNIPSTSMKFGFVKGGDKTNRGTGAVRGNTCLEHDLIVMDTADHNVGVSDING